MNVLFNSSDLFAPITGISLTSLFINNTDADEINVYIIENQISEENKEKLYTTAKKYGRNLEFVKIPEFLMDMQVDIPARWSITCLGRLFSMAIFPNMDKLLCLDSDIVVGGSLKDLWEMNMDNAMVAGSLDCISDDYKTTIGLKPENTYFNAGLLVFNLKRIREFGLEEKYRKYVKAHGKHLMILEQEVMNACIPEEEKLELEPKYNSYTLIHYLSYEQIKVCRNIHYSLWNEKLYEEAKKHPVVIHYTSCFLEGSRPWMDGDKHPLKHIYEEYKKKSLWADTPAWDNKKNTKQKMISVIVKITPRAILLPLVGYVHGVVLPRKNRKERELNMIGKA